MSHIFDALQRSESELSGSEASSFEMATELLQAAEEKMRAADRQGPAAVASADRALETVADPSRVDPNPSFPADLERCPCLSVSIPTESRLVSVEKEESLGAEKFRFLAVRLRQLRQSRPLDRPLKKILVTSTIPQEGKSTVAANLACTLARRKPQRTLLLEGDLRRPTVAARFGLGRIPGLSEWFRRKVRR